MFTIFKDASGNEIAARPQVVIVGQGVEMVYDSVKGEATLGLLATETEARTATAAGLTTGAISALIGKKKVVPVTSGAATSQIALPPATEATIGQELFLVVGANGYELITPASSNATINQVDGDGTNQLDVAANTTLWCVQVAAAAWIAVQVAATAITVVAPDND